MSEPEKGWNRIGVIIVTPALLEEEKEAQESSRPCLRCHSKEVAEPAWDVAPTVWPHPHRLCLQAVLTVTADGRVSMTYIFSSNHAFRKRGL